MTSFLLTLFLGIITLVVVFFLSSFLQQRWRGARREYLFFLMTHLSLAFFVAFLWLIKLDVTSIDESLRGMKVSAGVAATFVLSVFLRSLFAKARAMSLRLPVLGALSCLYLEFQWAVFVVFFSLLVIAWVLVTHQHQWRWLWRSYRWVILLMSIMLLTGFFLPLSFTARELVVTFLLIPFLVSLFSFLNLLKVRTILKTIPQKDAS